MRQPIRDCNCEDWPCCEHADNYALSLEQVQERIEARLDEEFYDCPNFPDCEDCSGCGDEAEDD